MLLSKSNDCPRCGQGHSNECFVTYENGWHCFSCGASYTTGGNCNSFRPAKLQGKALYLPDDMITDPVKFSLDIAHWLYSSHIYKGLITKYNIVYLAYDKFTTKTGRSYAGESLLFPVIKNDAIVYYQRRFFPDKAILSVGDSRVVFIAGVDDCGKIVIVEDFISAIRVGETRPCLCLFGTKLKQEQIDVILKHYTDITLWLDGDEPGQTAASKIFTKLKSEIAREQDARAFDKKSYSLCNIKTKTDPKAFTDTEIESILTYNIGEIRNEK